MPNNPTFRISAAVVKQLGEELVSDELTAIMELVKNSYDADADWVKISIHTTASPEENLTFHGKKGYIIIEDNGEGMTYNDIVDKWLFISLSHKRDMKIKGLVTKKGRTPLGDKGLGRLSTQRLGNVLEMFTGTLEEEIKHHVAFDWRDFTEESSLESVNTNYKSSSKLKSKKGTKLIITDLKAPNIWAGEAGDKFRGQLSKLIFPFKETRPFSVYLNINGLPIDLDEINEKLRELAISRYSFIFKGSKLTIKGLVKLDKLQGSNSSEKKELFNKLVQQDKGKEFFGFLTNQELNKRYFIPNLNYSGKNGVFFQYERTFDFEMDTSTEKINVLIDGKPQAIFANPGSFVGEIDEFNLGGTEEVEAAYDKLSEYKQLVKNQVGVRVFRDGFGIKPYGMGDDDWLKLNKGQTSGGSFYLLRPENIIGFVSIKASDNKNLVEKTDREGFIDSPYSKNFFNIINTTISEINSVLEKTRRTYDEYKKQEAQIKGQIITFRDTKDRLLKTARQSAAIEEQANKVSKGLKKTGAEVSAAVSEIKRAPLFSSEQENKALKILEEVERLLKDAEETFNKVMLILDSAKKLENDANYLEPKINELENQIIQFSELAGLGITAEAFTHEMYNVIDRIGTQTEQIIKQLKGDNNSNIAFYTYTEQVKSFVNSIRRQLNHLAPSLKFNRETKSEILIAEFIEDIKRYYKNRSENINFKINVIEDFSVNMNRGKLTQITDNIILNSEYWLNEIAEKDSSFKPEITIEIRKPNIYVSDNGYGIPQAIETTLFQPFVTTKPRGVGRGLGLFIVQQLVDSVSGNIQLLNKSNQHGRRFTFQINFESIVI